MSAQDMYAEIAPFYDLEFDAFDLDVELYLGYAQMVGDPILELGCGTGRLIQHLARAGFEVIGLDSSAQMLELARKRLESERDDDTVRLVEADMRSLDGLDRQPFRLIFAAINSFLHLNSRADQLLALAQIRTVIHRDGLLVIDVFNPTPETLNRMDDRLAFDTSWVLESGLRVERFSHRHLDSSTQVITTSLFYDLVEPDGQMKRVTTSYQMRYVHRFELEALLSESGFEIEGFYGSYQLDPLEHDSEQLIAVAHRTPNPGES